VCGDYGYDTVTVGEEQVNDYLTTKVGAINALTLLKEFQLVTFEILDLSKNRIEGNRIELKGEEGTSAPPPPDPPPQPEQEVLIPPELEKPVELHWLAQLWNEKRSWTLPTPGSFPEVRSVSPKNLAKIEKRLEERPDRADWVTIIDNARESAFLRTWPGFEFWWLMKNEENPRKVFQGNYRDKVDPKRAPPAASLAPVAGAKTASERAAEAYAMHGESFGGHDVK